MSYKIENQRNRIVIGRDLSFTEEIRGAFNKFPDFFVQAFKIVVDS